MGECVFCQIINKIAESKIVYEDRWLIAFLDIAPINEGHILIVPKMHVDSIEKVPLEILNKMFALAQKIVLVYQEMYGAKGYSMMQNGGAFCDFGHFHLHIFPRYLHDGFGWCASEEVFTCSKEVADKLKVVLERFK